MIIIIKLNIKELPEGFFNDSSHTLYIVTRFSKKSVEANKRDFYFFYLGQLSP